MTEEESKRRPGRPPKPAHERLEQTTVRLNTQTKRGLELIARLRRISQSEAVGVAVKMALRYFYVGPESLDDVLDSLGEVDPALTPDGLGGRAALAIELRRHADKLLDPTEQFFVAFLRSISRNPPSTKTAEGLEEIERLWDFATDGYMRGMTVEETADVYVGQTRSKKA